MRGLATSKPNSLAAALMLLALAVAGCGAPRVGSVPPYERVPPDGPHEVLGCYGRACPADPNSTDAKRALDQFGLHQITSGGGGVAPWMEGAWVVWQQETEVNGTFADDILALNLSSRHIWVLGGGDDYLQTRQYVSDGRVVFGEQPNRLHPAGRLPTYMVLWDSHTNQRRVLDPGLGGDQLPSDFSGSWVLFRVKQAKAAENNGIWAFNVDDGRGVKLYAPPKSTPTGLEEVVESESLRDGFAYYSLQLGDVNRHTRNSTVFEVNLETGDRRVFLHVDAGITNIIATSWGLVWDQIYGVDSGDAWLANRSTAQPMKVSTPDDRAPVAPAAGGNWVLYSPIPLDRPYQGVYAPTLDRSNLVDQDGSLPASSPWTTDGFRMVGAAYRHSEAFEEPGTDLYWKDLPGIP